MRITLYSMIFCLGLLSCTKEATIKLPKQENKLVVTCFISPDISILNAIVTESQPKYGNTFSQNQNNLQNATVMLTDGTSSIQLAYNIGFSAYTANTTDFPIVAGRSYSLSVSTPDGRHVSANTMVPIEQLEISSINIHVDAPKSFPGSTFFSEEIKYDITTVVADIPGKTTYVDFGYQQLAVRQGFGGQGDTIYLGYNNSDPDFETDELISKDTYTDKNEDELVMQDSIQQAFAKVAILNCNNDFYKYNQSVWNARDSDGNPFAEPVFVYTNINGGFGCFGAYRSVVRLVKIK